MYKQLVELLYSEFVGRQFIVCLEGWSCNVTPFTPAAKRFRVLIRLLPRHPVAYVARSWDFMLLMTNVR